MNPRAEDWPDSPRLVSLGDAPVEDVQVIKTLEDPVFGQVHFGRLTYVGKPETHYTYIKRFSPDQAMPPQELWRLAASCRRYPEKGHIPRLLAYSTQSEDLHGYLDVHQSPDVDSSRDLGLMQFSPKAIRELYFEPFRENLRTLLHKRARDHLPFTEEELLLFVCCSTKTMAHLQAEGRPHGSLSLYGFIPQLPGPYLLLHPCLLPSPSSLFERVHSQPKTYISPETLDYILECADEEEYMQVVSDLDIYRSDVFALGLILLELATLVEEDTWLAEDMVFKKDIVNLKLNFLRETYSPRLALIAETLLSTHRLRPDWAGMLRLLPHAPTDPSVFHKLQTALDLAEDATSQHLPLSDRSSAGSPSANLSISDEDVGSPRVGRWTNRGCQPLLPQMQSQRDSLLLSPEELRQPSLSTHTLDGFQTPQQVPSHETPTEEPVKPFLPSATLRPLTHLSQALIPLDPSVQERKNIPSNYTPIPASPMSGHLPLPISMPQVAQSQAPLPGGSSIVIRSNNLPRPEQPIWPPEYRMNPPEPSRLLKYYDSPNSRPNDTLQGEGFRGFDSFRLDDRATSMFPRSEQKEPSFRPSPIPLPEPTPQGPRPRSPSPNVVSVKRYAIRDGQRVLLSEETFPQGTSVPSTLTPQSPSRSRLPSQPSYQLPSQLPSQPPYQLPSQLPSQPPYQLPSQMPSQPSYQLPSQFPPQISSQMPSQFPRQVPSSPPKPFVSFTEPFSSSQQSPFPQPPQYLKEDPYKHSPHFYQAPLKTPEFEFRSPVVPSVPSMAAQTQTITPGLDWVPLATTSFVPQKHVHSLADLSRDSKGPESDFFRVAQEIKDKLDQLIIRESNHHPQPAEDTKPDHTIIPRHTPEKAGPGVQRLHVGIIPKAAVYCCAECRRHDRQRERELRTCLHAHPHTPDTRPSLSRSPRPQHQPLGSPEEVCPRYLRSIGSPSARTLSPLLPDRATLQQARQLKRRADPKRLEAELITAAATDPLRHLRSKLRIAKERRLAARDPS